LGPGAALPTWICETLLRGRGHAPVAGADEAGRGSLAGPVVAAAVILDERCVPKGIDDSKRLPAHTRAALAIRIRDTAIAWAVAAVEPEEIDRINILEATRKATCLALEALTPRPAAVLLDALRLPAWAGPQTVLVHGDRISLSIAAASILAKTHRDELMRLSAGDWPGYGFERHKGYGTPAHLDSLRRLGPCAVHRRTFRGVLPDPGLFGGT